MSNIIPVYYYKEEDNTIKNNNKIIKKKIKNKKEMINHLFDNNSMFMRYYVIIENKIIKLYKLGTKLCKEIEESEIQYIYVNYDFYIDNKTFAVIHTAEETENYEFVKIKDDEELLKKAKFINYYNVQDYYYLKENNKYILYYKNNEEYIRGKTLDEPSKFNNLYEIEEYINKNK